MLLPSAMCAPMLLPSAMCAQVYLQETSYVTPFSLLLWGSNIRHLRHTEDGSGPTIKRYLHVPNFYVTAAEFVKHKIKTLQRSH
jgi:hypothetical protein